MLRKQLFDKLFVGISHHVGEHFHPYTHTPALKQGKQGLWTQCLSRVKHNMHACESSRVQIVTQRCKWRPLVFLHKARARERVHAGGWRNFLALDAAKHKSKIVYMCCSLGFAAGQQLRDGPSSGAPELLMASARWFCRLASYYAAESQKAAHTTNRTHDDRPQHKHPAKKGAPTVSTEKEHWIKKNIWREREVFIKDVNIN